MKSTKPLNWGFCFIITYIWHTLCTKESLMNTGIALPGLEAKYRAKSEKEAWSNFLILSAHCDRPPLLPTLVTTTFLNMTNTLSIYSLIDDSRSLMLMDVPLKAQEHGVEAMLDGSLSYIHHDDRSTLFCLCYELIICDGKPSEIKRDMVSMIKSKLQLDDETCSGLMKYAAVRNRKNYLEVKM